MNISFQKNELPNVCILTSVHTLFDVRIFHKQAKSLAYNGYGVTLVAQSDQRRVIEGIKIDNLKKPSNRIERMIKTAWDVYRKAVKNKADIYHIHDPELLLVGFLLKACGKIVIYDMHENLPKQIRNKHWVHPVLRYFLSITVKYLEPILLSNTPVVFAEHSYRKDYPWVKKYVTVLNMPIQSLSLLEDRESSSSGKFSIGYIGVVSSSRGCFETIDALEILKQKQIDVWFDCVGPIRNPDEMNLIQYCKDKNIQNIVFHGYCPAHEGWKIIKRCQVGLALLHPIPNYFESYPTKIFEYMAMGIPVITSNFPLYKSLVEDNNCGICVDPFDTNEIANAIRWVYEHPTVAKRMGERGRQAVHKQYNWHIEFKKLKDFYQTILRETKN